MRNTLLLLRPTRRVLAQLLTVLLLSLPAALSAQSVSVKNNLLYDATLTPNLGVEVKVSDRSTLQLFYGWNPWKFSGEKKLRHWSLMPEWRYWLGKDPKPFERWFVGIHALGGEYNVGGVHLPLGIWKSLKSSRYEGWYAGGGITAGYAWPLSCHWKLEAALGIGVVYTDYEKYVNEWCGDQLADRSKVLVGPTKLALNIAYVVGGTCPKPQPVLPPVVTPAVEAPLFLLSYLVPQAEAQKTRELSGKAYLDFPVNQVGINPDYRSNAQELARVGETLDVVKADPNVSVTHVSIHGYASPEGTYPNNQRLAQGRAQTFKDYIQSLLPLDDDLFTVESTPEDWDGLIAALDKADGIDQLAQIRELAQSDLAPDTKERRLKATYPKQWQLLLDSIFPSLRHSDYTVAYTIRPFTPEEARDILRTKPQQLSLSELYQLANTYTPGSDEFSEVFLTAARLYPNDPTANLNAAVTALRRGDLTSADRYLQKAGDTPQAQQARQALQAKRDNPYTRIETK